MLVGPGDAATSVVMSGVACASYRREMAATLDWKPCPWCQRPLQVRIKRVDTSADGQPSFIEVPRRLGLLHERPHAAGDI